MWTLVKSQAEWTDYRVKTAQQLQVDQRAVDWGTGPKSYPCLVCTLMPPRPSGAPPRLYSAYVYEADAAALLGAAGKLVRDPDLPQPPNQHQFNRFTAAQMLTVIDFMVRTGVCKPEAFEERLLEMLELVDGAVDAQKSPAHLRAAVDTVRKIAKA